MEAEAILRYLKTSPQKTRLVVDLIRGKKVYEAITILNYSENECSQALRGSLEIGQDWGLQWRKFML